MLTQRHKDQIEKLIGTKITVYISLKKNIKVLMQDKDGLYIRHKNERVPCKPDTNTLDILYFTATDPKFRRRE